MDIIKFNNQPGTCILKNGEFINGIKTIEWIERYREPGEFTITAPVSAGIQEKLTIGSFITHLGSDDAMVVESHEIKDKIGEPVDIVISGRSLLSLLERRAGGFPSVIGQPGWTWNTPPSQILVAGNKGKITLTLLETRFILEYLIKTVIHWDSVACINERIQGLQLLYPSSSHSFYNETFHEEYVVPNKDILSSVLDIAEIDNLGLKFVRPRAESSAFEGLPGSENVAIYIHQGRDMTRTGDGGITNPDSVIFASDFDSLSEAEYLWSDKSYYNAVFMTTTHRIYIFQDTTVSGVDRRVLNVSFTDVDSDFSDEEAASASYPTTAVRNACLSEAKRQLRKNRRTSLVSIEANRDTRQFIYRKDYHIGDLVTVAYDYEEASIKRVIEHVEIQDESGETSYPVFEEYNMDWPE